MKAQLVILLIVMCLAFECYAAPHPRDFCNIGKLKH